MLDLRTSMGEHAAPSEPVSGSTDAVSSPLSHMDVLVQGFPMQRRRLHRKQALFHVGQPCHSLFLVHAGLFKTCVVSVDGREKITGFHLRGSLLGLDSYDMPTYACDAVALDTSEVFELPLAQLRQQSPELLTHVTSMLAEEIRRDWSWMLALGTLNADQRVVAFLLDLASRLQAMGFSARHVLLRMTRAELGNFLALQLETVTRALSRLASAGLITVNGRDVRIEDDAGLRALIAR